MQFQWDVIDRSGISMIADALQVEASRTSSLRRHTLVA
jgi:hypothetical protein